MGCSWTLKGTRLQISPTYRHVIPTSALIRSVRYSLVSHPAKFGFAVCMQEEHATNASLNMRGLNGPWLDCVSHLELQVQGYILCTC